MVYFNSLKDIDNLSSRGESSQEMFFLWTLNLLMWSFHKIQVFLYKHFTYKKIICLACRLQPLPIYMIFPFRMYGITVLLSFVVFNHNLLFHNPSSSLWFFLSFIKIKLFVKKLLSLFLCVSFSFFLVVSSNIFVVPIFLKSSLFFTYSVYSILNIYQ